MTPSVKVGRIGLDIMSRQSLHHIISQTITNDKKKIILHINARLVELSHSKEKWLISYLHEVDHAFCDGGGIQLAAKLTGQQVPEKITYNVWLWQLAQLCQDNNFSLYLVGGDQDVLTKAIMNLRKQAPALKVGGHHGYFNKQVGHVDNEAVVSEINGFRPNVLLVCFGMPMQEKWLSENSGRIKANVFLTGGGALDYISGRVKTTPKIFSDLYLEWLYRLCQDPLRLWKRYLLGNLIFIRVLIMNK